MTTERLSNEESKRKYDEDLASMKEAERMVKSYTCGECDGPLTLMKAAEGWADVCSENWEHKTRKRIKSATELYREGVGMPAYMNQHFERQEAGGMTLQVMQKTWQLKHPNLSDAGAYIAALYSLELGLDPRFNEIACLEFKVTGEKSEQKITVPQVMITEKGWQRLAVRHCPDLFVAAPVVEMITDKDMKRDLGAQPEDFVAIGHGRLRTDTEDMPSRKSLGIYKAHEYENAKKSSHKPGGSFPMNQAMVRASRHWYEDNLPQAEEYARAAFSRAEAHVDLQGMEAVIASEFSSERKINLGNGDQGNQGQQGQQRRSASKKTTPPKGS